MYHLPGRESGNPGISKFAGPHDGSTDATAVLHLCCIRVSFFEKPDDCNGAGLPGLSRRNGSLAVRGLLHTNIQHAICAQHERSKSTRCQRITTIFDPSIGLLYFSTHGLLYFRTCVPVMSLSFVVWHLAVPTPEQAVLPRTSTQRPALVTCADLPTDLGRRPTLNQPSR